MEKAKRIVIILVLRSVAFHSPFANTNDVTRFTLVGDNLMDSATTPIKSTTLNSTIECLALCLRTRGCFALNIHYFAMEIYHCNILPKNLSLAHVGFKKIEGWSYVVLGELALVGQHCDPRKANPCYLSKCQQLPGFETHKCVPFASCETAMVGITLTVMDAQMELPYPSLVVPVKCKRDGSKVWTVFPHKDSSIFTKVGNDDRYESAGSYRHQLVYEAAMEHIISAVDQMTTCHQAVVLKCRNSLFLREDHGWVEGRQGKKLNYFGNVPASKTGCECGTTNSCANKEYKCNCDANDDVDREEKGKFVRKEDLPLTGIRLGDLGAATEYAEFTFRRLRCRF